MVLLFIYENYCIIFMLNMFLMNYSNFCIVNNVIFVKYQ